MATELMAKRQAESGEMDVHNPYLDKKGRTSKSRCEDKQGAYVKVIKPTADKILSFGGLVLLAPIFAAIGIAIYLDDPGPVLFTQKRVGKDGHFFKLHKFRTMKLSAPHDVPTHQLQNPEQYITRIGSMLRKTSLDELPQIWDIFRGRMSIIGPRPALWNQEDLVAEREKYGANGILPGLTGLAQIKGRDELEIPEKAALDGEYTSVLNKGCMAAFLQDLGCFVGTVTSVLRHEGVVEGGTGARHKKAVGAVNETDAGFEDYGYKKAFHIDKTCSRRVLITGANSYIGESFAAYAKVYYPNLTIDTIDMIDGTWKEHDFSSYDSVFHVAGIAHADVGKVSEEEKARYYAVNTDLAIETCKKAKEAGVAQFIFMSSMIVYGDSAPYGKEKVIDEYTMPAPASFYGDSKWQADKGVRAMQAPDFHVAVLRPPMIYGRGSKGNYSMLAKLAKRLPVFPDVENQRSMLYIGNLCEFLCLLVLSGEGGVYFPQNGEYAHTTELVKNISKAIGKEVHALRILKPAVRLTSHFSGKVGRLVNKAFGNIVYSQSLSIYNGLDYHIVSFDASIKQSEEKAGEKSKSHSLDTGYHKSALIVASVASMIDQFIIPNIRLLVELGYHVDVATNFVNGSTCTEEKVRELIKLLDEMSVDCYQIDFDRNVTRFKAVVEAFRQLNDVVRGVAVPVNSARNHYMNHEGGYDFIHSHSPIGGVIGRVVAKKHHIKTIYTAHGFHFYSGAPKMNWALFYPIEKGLSYITDVLITINREDYKIAKRKFKAKEIVYVPGIGVDIEKFADIDVDRKAKRAEFAIGDSDIMFLSVGELNENKNHKVVIQALGQIRKSAPHISCNLHYCIAGKGKLYEELIELATSMGVNLHMLGFRNDVAELLMAADVFLLPSIREGLNVGLMEAMASGLPCIVSDIRGNRDLIVDKAGGYLVPSQTIHEWSKALSNYAELMRNHAGKFNRERIEDFSEKSVLEKLAQYYTDNQL